MDILKVRERLRTKVEDAKTPTETAPAKIETPPPTPPETLEEKPRPPKKQKKARAKAASKKEPVPVEDSIEIGDVFEEESQTSFDAAIPPVAAQKIPAGAIPPEEMELSEKDMNELYGTQEMPELPEMDIHPDSTHEMMLEKPASTPEAPLKIEEKPKPTQPQAKQEPAKQVAKTEPKSDKKPPKAEEEKEEQPIESAETSEKESKESEETQIELLSFMLGREEYALPLARISEIIKPRAITEVPRCPRFVLGILSLRGVVIPVFDLAARLSLGKTQWSKFARIVIVRRFDDELVGLSVDKVQDVVRVLSCDVEPPPPAMVGAEAQFLEGVGRAEDSRRIRAEDQEENKNAAAEAKRKMARRKLVILLNLDKVATL